MRYHRRVGDSGIERAALRLAGLTSPAHRGARAHGGLDGLTLAPVPGALTAILGPAGAGKSALIRALAGFGHTRGTMALDGHDLARIPASKRGFGVLLQPDVLFAHMTLAQNVAFPLRMRGIKRHARPGLVAEALSLVQLDGCGGWLPHQASAAQRQRAMLARATVAAPRVLLLDEPFSAQDPQARAALVAALRHIHGLLGMTTLLATSVGADALAVADHVAVLRAGAVEQCGAPEEVFDRPRNDYVAALLGETNRLPGAIVEIDEDIALVRLACGPLVEATPGRTLAPGDACMLTLRPDRIAVAAASAAEMGDGALDATLIEAQFLGDSYRLRLLIGSGAEIVVRRPAAAGLRGLVVGRGVALAWQAQHAFAFRLSK